MRSHEFQWWREFRPVLFNSPVFFFYVLLSKESIMGDTHDNQRTKEACCVIVKLWWLQVGMEKFRRRGAKLKIEKSSSHELFLTKIKQVETLSKCNYVISDGLAINYYHSYIYTHWHMNFPLRYVLIKIWFCTFLPKFLKFLPFIRFWLVEKCRYLTQFDYNRVSVR